MGWGGGNRLHPSFVGGLLEGTHDRPSEFLHSGGGGVVGLKKRLQEAVFSPGTHCVATWWGKPGPRRAPGAVPPLCGDRQGVPRKSRWGGWDRDQMRPGRWGEGTCPPKTQAAACSCGPGRSTPELNHSVGAQKCFSPAWHLLVGILDGYGVGPISGWGVVDGVGAISIVTHLYRLGHT